MESMQNQMRSMVGVIDALKTGIFGSRQQPGAASHNTGRRPNSLGREESGHPYLSKTGQPLYAT